MTLNPTTEHGVQPFTSNQKVILEKRTPEGTLDLSDPQPPLKIYEVGGRGVSKIGGREHTTSRDLTFDDVYNLMFNACPDAQGSWETLRAWLDSKSWVVRTKTW